MPTPQYLSTDPTAGDPVAKSGGYLSTDPTDGERADFKTENARDEQGQPVVAGAGERFLSGFARNVLPSTTPSDYIDGPKYAMQHPMDSMGLLLKALWDAHAGQAGKTLDSAKRVISTPGLNGKVLAADEMLGHGLATALPIVGPAAANAGEQIGSGDIAGGLGAAAGVLAPMGTKRLTAKLPAIIRSAPANPAEASAVAFADRSGIPVDAGTRSGSQFIKNVQKKVGSSLGGANVVETAQRGQSDALARTGNDLVDRANPGKPSTPLSAGESVDAALRKRIEDLHAEADAAYSKLREIEAKPPQRPPRSQSLTALDVSQRTPLAVDVTAAVEQLQPLYKRLLRESELGLPMQGAKGRTLAALDGLMNAPNWAPLSVVDAALGDLKALARGADMPELRTAGQATAAEAVRALDSQVRAAAAKAGPEVLRALEEGRAATKAKYTTSEARDLIASTEPRSTFNRLTANADTGVAKLRELQKQTPDQIPIVARSVLTDILDKPTSEGGFKFADKAQADWQRLGSATKQILFKRDHIKALDDFFLLAKKIGENPNPSGTAQVMNATNVVAYLPSKVLAKLLYTPGGVKALSTSLRLGVSPKPAAAVAAMSQLKSAADVAGVSLPKVANGDDATDRANSPRVSRRGSPQ